MQKHIIYTTRLNERICATYPYGLLIALRMQYVIHKRFVLSYLTVTQNTTTLRARL